MKRKKDLNEIPEQTRLFLRDLAKSRINSAKEKKDAAKAADVSEAAIETMIYHGKGGLNAWVKLIAYLYELSADQVKSLLTELRNSLRKNRKLSEIELKWSELTEQLTDDRKKFWHDVIQMIDPVYKIKRKRVGRSK